MADKTQNQDDERLLIQHKDGHLSRMKVSVADKLARKPGNRIFILDRPDVDLTDDKDQGGNDEQ